MWLLHSWICKKTFFNALQIYEIAHKDDLLLVMLSFV